MSFSSVSLRLTASDLLKEYEKQHVVLSSGNSQLDLLLGGGFREGIVTEICGEASAGKTQICLQLLLQACLPKSMGGLYASSCYISTEGIGFMKRLHSLADAFASQYHFLTNITTTAINTSTIEQKRQKTSHHQRGNPNYFLDKIYIEQAYEVEDLLELMHKRLPTLLEEQHVQLVILDSIAAIFRTETTTSIKEASERSHLMFHLANCMRILSAQYHCIFVVTNQVSSNMKTEKGLYQNLTMRPALGLSWSHCINQRLMLQRTQKIGRRNLQVVFSPSLASNTSIEMEITNQGMVTFKEEEEKKQDPIFI